VDGRRQGAAAVAARLQWRRGSQTAQEVPMFNEAHISLTGYVATQPRYSPTRTGIPRLTMRVAWTPRRMDQVTGEWADDSTSFLTVLCWRKLAENAATCLRKGDPVVVKGRFSIRGYEDKNGVQRTAVEVDASSVGHDLGRGVAQFQRVRPQTGLTAMEYAAEGAAPGGAATGTGPGPDGEVSAAGPDERGSGEGSAAAADEIFDDGAIEALAARAEAVAAPF